MKESTIIEKYIEDYPIPITLESTEIILSQMKSSVCKIYLDNGNKGTGFFCKIPYPDNTNLKPFLVTNNHVIDESYLNKDKSFEITINNDKITKKLIIGNRINYTSKIYDTTIIEIYEDKDNIKDFLQLDFNINEDNFNNKYINKSIYTLHYPNCEKIAVSYGIIKSIDLNNNYSLYHLCSTDKGSSGSPILNIRTNKLIGIHKGSSNNYNFNKGTLLFYPFKEFISKINQNIVLNAPNKSIIYENITLTGSALKRIKKEIQSYKIINPDGYQIFGIIKDVMYGVLMGLHDTPYENGFFLFILKYNNDYPLKSPHFRFLTKMFHPNIDPNGLLSFDDSDWSPALAFYDIIPLIQGLFGEPNCDDFYNAYAAKLYKENRQEYNRTVKKYIEQYANFDTAQNELKKYGFKMDLEILIGNNK